MSENIPTCRLHSGQNEDPKYQEVRLRVNEAFINALLPKLSDGILMLNLEGVFQVANRAALTVLNIEAESLLQRRFWDLFSDEHFGFSMRESFRYGISHPLIYKSLPPKELEISTSFLYDGPKEERGLMLFLRDITHTQKLQQLVMRADRMKELGETATKLAHEIRNCLGGIRGFACLLFRDLSNHPNLQEMISRILEGTKALEKLVTSVLIYARPIELSEQTVNLPQFLKQVAKIFKVDPNLPANLQFNLYIPDEKILVPLDPDALQRALMNLLLNGAQAIEQRRELYCRQHETLILGSSETKANRSEVFRMRKPFPEGKGDEEDRLGEVVASPKSKFHADGSITLSLLKYETNCQISISDTGIGMNEEQLNSLFSPFFTTKPNGNGLGLVETKKIIQGHGGTINVHSTPGRGSTFLITLPLKRHQ